MYQIFKITLSTIIKKHETLTDNPPVQMHINKIGNKITFKIKSGYYLDNLPKSRVLYALTSNKRFGSLIDILLSAFMFLKTFKSEFLHLSLWFTKQNSLLVEIQINSILVINWCVYIYRMRYSSEPKGLIYVKDYGFLSFAKKAICM